MNNNLCTSYPVDEHFEQMRNSVKTNGTLVITRRAEVGQNPFHRYYTIVDINIILSYINSYYSKTVNNITQRFATIGPNNDALLQNTHSRTRKRKRLGRILNDGDRDDSFITLTDGQMTIPRLD